MTPFSYFTDLRISLILTPIFADFRMLMRVPFAAEWGYRVYPFPQALVLSARFHVMTDPYGTLIK